MANLTTEIVARWSTLLENAQDENGAFLKESSEVIKSLEKQMKFPNIKIGAKQAYGKLIVDHLSGAPEKIQCNILSLLRIICRDDTGLGSLLTQEVCREFMTIAFPTSSSENVDAILEAEKCIINSLFHSVVARDVFAESYVDTLLDRVEEVSHKFTEGDFTEMGNNRYRYLKLFPTGILTQFFFFDLRLCFVVSATQPKVKIQWTLSESTLATFYRILEFSTKPVFTGTALTKEEDDTANEALKILYNIVCGTEFNQYTETASKCAVLSKQLILNVHILEPTKQNVVNILYRLDRHIIRFAPKLEKEELEKADPENTYEDYDISFPKAILHGLKDKFDKTPRSESGLLVSYFAVLHFICRHSKGARRYCRRMVLPPLRASDVKHRPDEGETLRAKIIRIMMNSSSATDMAAEFLFTLCKQSPGRMMKYCGLGHSAGLFANKGLFGSLNRVRNESDSEDSETDDYKEVQSQVNPVTGFINPIRENSAWENMSEEQKEYEAMKMVEAMSKLMDTGVIQPGTIGPDGKPKAVGHVCELLNSQREHRKDDSDSD